MEIPDRTCPDGGVALIGQGYLDPADHWTVSCSICGHVGSVTTGRVYADDLAARHMREGYVTLPGPARLGGTLVFIETEAPDAP